MAARTLSQIVAELDPTYTPQIESIRQRQAAIPGQIEAEEKGLQAKQENAFGDILGGARRRGLGFSGIPLAEQAKYTATEYLPALARLRQSGNEQRMSLEDAILGIQERRNTLAQQVYQQEQDRAWQREQFERQMEESRRQAAAAARASSFSPSFGAIGGGAPTQAAAGKKLTIQDQAYLSVQRFLQGDNRSIMSDYLATLKSAQKGNAMDKLKIQLYNSSRPDLFGNLKPAQKQPGWMIMKPAAKPTATPSMYSRQGASNFIGGF